MLEQLQRHPRTFIPYGRRYKEKKPEAGDILTTRGGRTIDF